MAHDQKDVMFRTLAELQRYFTAEDRRQWVVLLTGSLAAGLSQSLTLAVFNDAAARYGEGRGNLLHLPLVIALAAVALGAGYFVAARGHVVSTRMAIRLRDRLLDRLGAANLRVLERIGGAALHYHLMNTVGGLASAYGTLLGFATSLVMLTCNFVYVGWLSPAGLVAAICVTLVGVTVHFRQERLNIARKQWLDHLTNTMSSRHREWLDGYKELRLFGGKLADYRARIDGVNAEMLVKGLEVTKTTTAGDLATYLFQFLLILVLVFLLPVIVKLDTVVIMQLMTAILVTMGPLSGVVGAIPGFTRAQVALGNLNMLEREIAATREPTEVAPGRELPPFESLELRGIEFAFDDADAPESFRLGPVDLAIRRGETLFVVGGNGSGKTVLMRVLTALYHQSAGAIVYNGRVLEESERQAYRELFSTVFSDFYLFSELLGVAEADASAIDSWLARLDLAGKTRVENGQFTSIALSAGQRKRLAFAVAMLEDRPIYVLDEFGAEQDPEHRRTFYRELLPALRERGKTVVVVTHDDAYFDAADRVVRMDYGRIVSIRERADTNPTQSDSLLEEDLPVQKTALVR
jgi:putative ATP-binding cassette transporter